MSFDWREYYQLSRSLLGKPGATATDEAKQRCAVSRSYYAAFNVAIDRIRQLDPNITLPQKGHEKHEFVIRHFYNRNDKMSGDIYEDLLSLRRSRNRVDYEASLRDLAKEADDAVRRTASTIDRLTKLRK